MKTIVVKLIALGFALYFVEAIANAAQLGQSELGTPYAIDLYSQAQQNLDSVPIEVQSSSTTSIELNDKINRIEQGLSPLLVVKGVTDKKMTLADRMKYHQVPAVSIAVVNNGQIEWARAYGVNAEGGMQTNTATLFQAASISKAVSAVAALNMVEQGKLNLDEDVNERLASWKIPESKFTNDKKVSLRHLLNHSAGINVHGFRGYDTTQEIPDLISVLKGKSPSNSAAIKMISVPGTAWKYSGGGYNIIQLLMSETSKQSFTKLMDETVLAPLEMTHSSFADTLSQNQSDNAAVAHNRKGIAIKGSWHHYPELAAAGLWTTPSDLAKIIIEVQKSEAGQSNKLLSSQMTNVMLTRLMGETGLGFFVEKHSDRSSFSHGGSNAGYRARLFGYTKTGQGVVVMTNGDNGGALIDEILTSIAAEYNWPDFKIKQKEMIAADPVQNKKFVGEYELFKQAAYITAEGEHLYLQADQMTGQTHQMVNGHNPRTSARYVSWSAA